MRSSAAIVLILMFGLAPTHALAGGETGGWFGFSLDVDIAGFALSPTVNAATVLEVAPNSPAAAAGIHGGDQLLEVGGLTVAGGKARELKAALAKAVGESLVIRLRRPSGETYRAVLAAARKPG
jgi:C-terminal processing protease CtpA/Prc